MVLLTDLQAPVRLQAILLQTKDWRILPLKLSLFSYVYPGVTVREHTGASDHGTGQTLPYGNTKARAYGTRLRVCAPALWKKAHFRGISPGEFAGENPLALFVVLRFVFAYGIP